MIINTICDTCIDAVRNVDYNESTIFNYESVVRRFKQFCNKRNVIKYSYLIGKSNTEDVVSDKTGSFSLNRYHTQGRFIRFVDSYFLTGIFDFSVIKKIRATPNNPIHNEIYENYKVYLQSTYNNGNTIHSYEYVMYCLLQFLNRINIKNIIDLQPFMIMQ